MMRYSILLLLLPFVFSCDRAASNFFVGVSQCSDDMWRETANREMLREASFDPDLSIEIRSAHDDSEEQIRDVEYFIDNKVDLLVVSPNEAASLTPVVTRAFRSGIPVILFDRKIDSDEYSTYVGADNVQIGEQIGDYLSSLALRAGRKQFRIIVIRGTYGSTADVERYEGLLKSIGKHRGIEIKIVSEAYADFIRKSSYDAMCRIIEDGIIDGSVDAIIAFNDEMAIGVHEALEELLPDQEHPQIVGVDALSGKGGGIDAIQDGIISASFIYPTGGDIVIDIVRKILHRNAFDRSYILNTALVNMDNAKVLSLQSQKMESNQFKLEELNRKLQNVTAVYGSQRRAMIALAILAGMILIMMLILLSLNRKRAYMNEVLNRQNAKIQEQIRTLESQNRQLTDLTKQLEDVTQARQVFYTNISHEFRTPLTLILGSTDLLADSSNICNDDRQSLRMIKKNARKLLSLINEILDFRTCESNQMTVNYSCFDLKLFLEEINTMFMDVARNKFVHFGFYCDNDDSFDVQMDKNKLEKIYFNILSNAFKFVKERGNVTVTLAKLSEKQQISLSVFNSDSFIPEEACLYIFNMFYTGNPMDANSSGIGLALAKSLAEAMNGDIVVESIESEGTTFTVTLPYLLSENSVQEKEFAFSYASRGLVSDKFSFEPQVPSEVLSPDDGRNTILIIEDSQDMQCLLKSILSQEYRVLQAFNGKDGLDKVYLYNPDLILSDIMMPAMDGYELCRKVKNNEKSRHVPIILLTACALDEQRAQGYETGADAFLQKPFSAEVLKTRIRNLLFKKNALLESSRYSWLVGDGNKSLSKESEVLDKIVQYVSEHIDETITIDILAQSVGISRANLYKKIKEVTDYSPIDIINMLKIRKALDLVLYKHMNITEAAYETGFNSLSYFSRTFVKYYKVPPRTWIKEHYGDFAV